MIDFYGHMIHRASDLFSYCDIFESSDNISPLCGLIKFNVKISLWNPELTNSWITPTILGTNLDN